VRQRLLDRLAASSPVGPETVCDKISLGINLNVTVRRRGSFVELGFGPIVAMDRQIFESSK
jgi:hypothetical protein